MRGATYDLGTLLERVSQNAPSKEDALDLIYEEIDEAHLAGEFDNVDALLRKIDPHKFPVVVGLAFISITKPAKVWLPSRPAYIERFKNFLRSLKESEDRIIRLLHGLI